MAKISLIYVSDKTKEHFVSIMSQRNLPVLTLTPTELLNNVDAVTNALVFIEDEAMMTIIDPSVISKCIVFVFADSPESVKIPSGYEGVEAILYKNNHSPEELFSLVDNYAPKLAPPPPPKPASVSIPVRVNPATAKSTTEAPTGDASPDYHPPSDRAGAQKKPTNLYSPAILVSFIVGILIISAIMLSLIFFRVYNASNGSNSASQTASSGAAAKAQTDFQSLSSALEAYKVSNGNYPKSVQLSEASSALSILIEDYGNIPTPDSADYKYQYISDGKTYNLYLTKK